MVHGGSEMIADIIDLVGYIIGIAALWVAAMSGVNEQVWMFMVAMVLLVISRVVQLAAWTIRKKGGAK